VREGGGSGGCCCLWVHRFCTQAVVFVCGRLSCGGGGGSLPWPVLVFCCHIAVSNVAPGFPVSKESGGRGVFTHLLVVIVASDVGPQCRWLGGGVGCSSLFMPFMGGVLLSSHCHLIMWCRPAVLVAWSSSVVVVVVVSHHCHQSWLLTWCSCIIRMVYQHVQVVVGGGQWCGNDGWASWVVVVVVEEGGCCCLLTCLLMPWCTEYIKVILLSFNGCLVQLLECSLIHACDVLQSQVFNSHT